MNATQNFWRFRRRTVPRSDFLLMCCQHTKGDISCQLWQMNKSPCLVFHGMSQACQGNAKLLSSAGAGSELPFGLQSNLNHKNVGQMLFLYVVPGDRARASIAAPILQPSPEHGKPQQQELPGGKTLISTLKTSPRREGDKGRRGGSAQ